MLSYYMIPGVMRGGVHTHVHFTDFGENQEGTPFTPQEHVRRTVSNRL